MSKQDYQIMKRILVTGANGFIGSKVIASLLEMGWKDIIAVDLDNSNIPNEAHFLNINLLENSKNENLCEELGNPNIIIHLAWRNGFVHNAQTHIDDLPAHFHLLDNFYSFPSLESISVMGTMHEIGYYKGMISANTPTNPTTLYGISKNALRQFAFSTKHTCQLKWLRAYYIYDNAGKGNSVFSKILKAAQQGNKTFPLTTGKNRCDYISLDSLAKQIICASIQREYNGIINVCSGTPISLKQAVTNFVNCNNLDISFEFGKFPDREYDSPIVFGDSNIIDNIMSNYESIIR